MVGQYIIEATRSLSLWVAKPITTLRGEFMHASVWAPPEGCIVAQNRWSVRLPVTEEIAGSSPVVTVRSGSSTGQSTALSRQKLRVRVPSIPLPGWVTGLPKGSLYIKIGMGAHPLTG